METTTNRSCLAGLASTVCMQCTAVVKDVVHTCALVCIHMCSNVITPVAGSGEMGLHGS